MQFSFPDIAQFAIGERRVQGDPRRPGGLPHHFSAIFSLGKLSDVGQIVR
jgi:hypothetical protein